MNIKFSFPQSQTVVTGGARGIGLEISRMFLDAGAAVAIWDFSRDNLESARNEFSGFQGRVSFNQVDVAKLDSCEQAASALGRPVDFVINNAGITRDKSFVKMSPEDFQAVIDTNLTGVFNVTKAILPKFNAHNSNKRIVNISSVVALYGNFGQTNYVAAKAGVIGLTKTWAREFARKGMTVNAIAPGFTLTLMVEAMPADVLGSLESKIPIGRLGQPYDIARACLFLCSEEAGYINGAVLNVDGGLVC